MNRKDAGGCQGKRLPATRQQHVPDDLMTEHRDSTNFGSREQYTKIVVYPLFPHRQQRGSKQIAYAEEKGVAYRCGWEDNNSNNNNNNSKRNRNPVMSLTIVAAGVQQQQKQTTNRHLLLPLYCAGGSHKL
uniref:Uncharacterized protein n=1 Tax=Glossina pallidipes TaxID=7398 RepID=A0A1A9ZME1_GLOPL